MKISSAVVEDVPFTIGHWLSEHLIYQDGRWKYLLLLLRMFSYDQACVEWTFSLSRWSMEISPSVFEDVPTTMENFV